VQSSIVTNETTSFSAVINSASLMNKKYGPTNILIVLDIDNTILTSSVDLGGDIWYRWQRGKFDIKPTIQQKVPCLYKDSIGLLYELVPMKLTEKDLPKIIADWQSSGNTVIALTSRAPENRAATERELENKKIYFELAALTPIDQKSPVYCETKERELSYMNGIMMTSGMNKGAMLKYILEKTNRRFDAVIIVDDLQENIDNFYAEFTESKNIDMTIFHYTNVETQRKKKYGAVLTNEQATKMASDWHKLNATLNEIFPARNLQGGCLSDKE